MSDLIKRIDDWLPYADEESGILASLLRDCRTEIERLSEIVAGQRKRFDIESNRVTFADHKSLHKMLIRDSIKKMNDCRGRPHSTWDTWLIDATCMLERVLREWPAPQEVTLSAAPPSVNALIAEIDGLVNPELHSLIQLKSILAIINKYREQVK